jgi:hypothetical protein
MNGRLIGFIAVVACCAATAGLVFAQPNTNQNTGNEPLQMDGGGALTSDLYDAGQASAALDASRVTSAWEASAAKATQGDAGPAEPTAAWDATPLEPTTTWEAGRSKAAAAWDATAAAP